MGSAPPAISLPAMSLPLAHPIVRPNSGGRKPSDPSPSWGERLPALPHLRTRLRLDWRAEPRSVGGLLVLRGERADIPVPLLRAGKLLVDVLATATRPGPGDASWRRLRV